MNHLFIFMEAYAPGKDDERAVQLILQLYGFAVANPRPEDWLNHCIESYGAESMETLEKAAVDVYNDRAAKDNPF